MTHEFFEAQKGNHLVTDVYLVFTLKKQMLSNVRNE